MLKSGTTGSWLTGMTTENVPTLLSRPLRKKPKKRNSRAKKGKVREEDANEEIKAWIARSQRSLKL